MAAEGDVDADGRPPKECATCKAPLPDRHATWCRVCTDKRGKEQSQRSSARYVQGIRDEIARLQALLSPTDVVRLPDGTVVLDSVTADWLHDLAQDVVTAVKFIDGSEQRAAEHGWTPEERHRRDLDDQSALRERALRVAREFQKAIGLPDGA